MTVTYTRATPADASALHELAAATFPLACPPGTTDQDIAAHVSAYLSVQQFRQWSTDQNVILIVARSTGGAAFPAGSLLGYSLVLHAAPTDPDIARVVGSEPTLELSKIYVLPQVQGSGVARGLMERTLQEAHELSPGSDIWLGTNGLNHRAQAFYRRHGFATVGTRRYRVGDQLHDDLVMLRELADLTPGQPPAPAPRPDLHRAER